MTPEQLAEAQRMVQAAAAPEPSALTIAAPLGDLQFIALVGLLQNMERALRGEPPRDPMETLLEGLNYVAHAYTFISPAALERRVGQLAELAAAEVERRSAEPTRPRIVT